MKHSMAPIVHETSRVLILGSMPGNISLEKGEYYANPKNHFWKILYELFGAAECTTYEEKVALLREKGLAVWDVIESCEREGSLDSNIRNAQINDLKGLLDRYPNIQAIVLNGGEADRRLKKKDRDQLNPKLQFIKLPSTSPVPGKNVLKFEEKVEVWRVICSIVNKI